MVSVVLPFATAKRDSQMAASVCESSADDASSITKMLMRHGSESAGRRHAHKVKSRGVRVRSGAYQTALGDGMPTR
jgi:hypothetical protein